MKGLFPLLALFILLSSCDPCREDCFSPPLPISIELVSAATGEDLFSNGTLNSSNISIINSLNGVEIPFEILENNSQNVLLITTIGWQTETYQLKFRNAEESLFEMYIDAVRISGECCTFTKYREIIIENAQYTFDNQTDIYTILLP